MGERFHKVLGQIGSLFLEVTRTAITSRTSSKFGRIGPRTGELAVFECLEKSLYTNSGEKFCDHSNPFILDCIIFILAGDKEMHKSLDEFKFWPDPTTDSGVICP